jgi:hypothetical protein
MFGQHFFGQPREPEMGPAPVRFLRSQPSASVRPDVRSIPGHLLSIPRGPRVPGYLQSLPRRPRVKQEPAKQPAADGKAVPAQSVRRRKRPATMFDFEHLRRESLIVDGSEDPEDIEDGPALSPAGERLVRRMKAAAAPRPGASRADETAPSDAGMRLQKRVLAAVRAGQFGARGRQ